MVILHFDQLILATYLKIFIKPCKKGKKNIILKINIITLSSLTSLTGDFGFPYSLATVFRVRSQFTIYSVTVSTTATTIKEFFFSLVIHIIL